MCSQKNLYGSSDLPPKTGPGIARVLWATSPKEDSVCKSRFTEDQIVGILKEHEAGADLGWLCQRHGISAQTFYRWKRVYAGLEVNQARRLRALDEENVRIERLVADQGLDNQVLKELLRK